MLPTYARAAHYAATPHSRQRFGTGIVAMTSYEGTVHQTILSGAAFLIATFRD